MSDSTLDSDIVSFKSLYENITNGRVSSAYVLDPVMDAFSPIATTKVDSKAILNPGNAMARQASLSGKESLTRPSLRLPIAKQSFAAASPLSRYEPRTALSSSTTSSPLPSSNNSQVSSSLDLDMEEESEKKVARLQEQLHSMTSDLENLQRAERYENLEPAAEPLKSSSRSSLASPRKERFNQLKNELQRTARKSAEPATFTLPVETDEEIPRYTTISENATALMVSERPCVTSRVLAEPNTSSHSSFDMEIVKALLTSACDGIRLQLRNDIQNMHVELIKQNLGQKIAMAEMFQQYLPSVSDLMDEIQGLRDDNERLRLRLGE